MTDKEKEAIERLKGIDIKIFLSGMAEQSNYIVDESDKTNIAIETVLNLIEKQQAKIKETNKQKHNQSSLRRLNERKMRKYRTENKGVKAELEKKDKIIDKMAEQLVKAHEWFYSEFDNYTKEDFIEYYKKKVEDK